MYNTCPTFLTDQTSMQKDVRFYFKTTSWKLSPEVTIIYEVPSESPLKIMVALNMDLSLFKGKNSSVIDIKVNEANSRNFTKFVCVTEPEKTGLMCT